ncbi:MAG TPA: histidine kinase dimerization/phospho-acceptor domain-containing protein, partial [Luteimonas sp.]|nr:histidine kinase dimerization/phospho-acceptor domain-containing protein [Luteimonas sp.]
MPRLSALPLRMRVTLLYTLLGLVMSLLFAGTVTFITEDYEGVLVEEILRSQADDYAQRLQHQPDTALPRSRRLSGYLRRKDGSGDVPDALAAFPPGLHESARKGQEDLHVGVFDTASGRLYFSIDLQNIERLELHMDLILVAIIVLGTLVSAWLGWLLSGSVVRPVRRLADAVDGLSTQPERTTLAAQLPDDELGRLGKAIDDYQARLVAAEDAERAFFADASHELRTPIAVVRGATELLLEDAADIPQLQPRLQRLDRGMRQLSE